MTLREEEAAESGVARVTADGRLVWASCAFRWLWLHRSEQGRWSPGKEWVCGCWGRKAQLSLLEQGCLLHPATSPWVQEQHISPCCGRFLGTPRTSPVYIRAHTFCGESQLVEVWCLQNELADPVICPEFCGWSVTCVVRRTCS